MNPDVNRSVIIAILFQKMIDLGIIPYFTNSSIVNELAKLPPEEARKAKRAFRKLHRKLIKNNYEFSWDGFKASAIRNERAKLEGEGIPLTREELIERKNIVFSKLWNQASNEYYRTLRRHSHKQDS